MCLARGAPARRQKIRPLGTEPVVSSSQGANEQVKFSTAVSEDYPQTHTEVELLLRPGRRPESALLAAVSVHGALYRSVQGLPGEPRKKRMISSNIAAGRSAHESPGCGGRSRR
jgi:hypothetical protein